jgi:hypothetical protein
MYLLFRSSRFDPRTITVQRRNNPVARSRHNHLAKRSLGEIPSTSGSARRAVWQDSPFERLAFDARHGGAERGPMR